MNFIKISLLYLIIIVNLSAILYSSSLKKDIILKKIEILSSSKEVDINKVKNSKFSSVEHNHIEVKNSKIWIKLELYNRLNRVYSPILYLNSNYLDSVKVYEVNGSKLDYLRDIGFKHRINNILYPYIELNFREKGIKNLYIQISSSKRALDFSIFVDNKESLFKKDRYSKLINILALGVTLVIASIFLLLLYYRAYKSYIFFIFFMLLSIYYNSYISGILSLFFSADLMALNAKIDTILLDSILILLSSATLYFLKLESSRVYSYYLATISILFVEIMLDIFLQLPKPIFIFGLLITLIFNLLSGLYSYKLGLKEVRLYILGILTYIAYTLGAVVFNIECIGYIYIASIVLLSIAYLDRYYLVYIRDMNYLVSSLDKKIILDNQIEQKKNSIKELEKSEAIIKRDISKRVNGTLISTVNILKMHNRRVYESNILDKLNSIEDNLLSISSIYTIFLNKPNINSIDMKEPIEELIKDRLNRYNKIDKELTISTSIDAKLKLQDAIYVAYSIISAIENSYKNKLKEHLDIKLKMELDGKHIISIKHTNLNSIKKSLWSK